MSACSNQWLGARVPGGEGLIDVYPYGGLIVLAPRVRLRCCSCSSFRLSCHGRDARGGGCAWRAPAHGALLWRINFPLLLPALLASGILSFVVAMESFEIPSCWAHQPASSYSRLRIYDLAYGGHVANFGAAMVLAVILLVLTGSSDRGAVAPARPVLHDCFRPRLQGTAARSRVRRMDSPSAPSSPSLSFSAPPCRSLCCC